MSKFGAQHQIDQELLVVAERAVERRRDLIGALDTDRVHPLTLRERIEPKVRRRKIETIGKGLVRRGRLLSRLGPVAPILLQIVFEDAVALVIAAPVFPFPRATAC